MTNKSMTDETEIYFNASDSISYLESLAKTKIYLSKIYKGDCSIMTKMDVLIETEIDLATMESEKAKSEILKDNTKKNVTPLKGA
jgi:hypothetical protein